MRCSTNMNDKPINEHIIKVTGKANILAGLDSDQEVVLLVRGSVVKREEESNQDGTYNMIYKVKIAAVELK
jgi:hypothetical protein